MEQIKNNLEQLLNCFYRWTRQLVTNPESIRHDRIEILKNSYNSHTRMIHRCRQKILVNLFKNGDKSRINVTMYHESGRTIFSVRKYKVDLSCYTFSDERPVDFFGITSLKARIDGFNLEKDYLNNVEVDYIRLVGGINAIFCDKKIEIDTPEGILDPQEAQNKGHMDTDKKRYIIEMFGPLL